MPEKDDKTFKEKRQERQEKRIDRLTQQRESEAKQAGVDKPIDIGPLGAERKERIDKIIEEGVSEDIKKGLGKIQDLRQPPEVETPELPEREYTIQDVRKQRRAKIADILNAFAQGATGSEITPRAFRDKLKEQELSQFKQYRDTAEASKKKLAEWQAPYIQDQLDYINNRLKSSNISESEKVQLDILKTKLEREKANTRMKLEEERQLKEGKDKKDDKDPMAKLTQDVGEGAKTTYEIPISEAKKRERQAKIDEATAVINSELEQAKIDLADMGDEGTKKREFIDKPKRDKLVAKIDELEAMRQEIIDDINSSYEQANLKEEIQNENTSEETKSDYQKILDEL